MIASFHIINVIHLTSLYEHRHLQGGVLWVLCVVKHLLAMMLWPLVRLVLQGCACLLALAAIAQPGLMQWVSCAAGLFQKKKKSHAPLAARCAGDKSAAKAAMSAAGVPVVPGYHGEDQSEERLLVRSTHPIPPLLSPTPPAHPPNDGPPPPKLQTPAPTETDSS